MTVAFLATATSTVSVAAGTYGKIPFGNAVSNVGNAFNTSAVNFVAPQAGSYHFDLQAGLQSLADGKIVAAALYVNGSPAYQGLLYPGAAAGETVALCSITIPLNQNDTVEAYVYNGDTVARTTIAATNHINMNFSGFLVA